MLPQEKGRTNVAGSDQLPLKRVMIKPASDKQKKKERIWPVSDQLPLKPVVIKPVVLKTEKLWPGTDQFPLRPNKENREIYIYIYIY